MANRKVQIDNETPYSTRDLRKLFTAVFRNYQKKHLNPPRIRVYCYMSKSQDPNWCSGYAYLNSTRLALGLPRAQDGYGEDTFSQRIARTLLHELDHCRGLSHGDMNIRGNLHGQKYDVSPYAHFAIKKRLSVSLPPPSTKDKIQKLLTKRKKWESKLKRAKTAISKLDKQTRYYTRKEKMWISKAWWKSRKLSQKSSQERS